MLLVYKTGLVEQIELRPLDTTTPYDISTVRSRFDEASWPVKEVRDTSTADNGNSGNTGVAGGHDTAGEELWKSLSANHWPTLFAYYNISLTGRFECFHYFIVGFGYAIYYTALLNLVNLSRCVNFVAHVNLLINALMCLH